LALDYAVSLAKRYDSHPYVTHIIYGGAYPLTAPEVTVSIFGQQRLEALKGAENIVASGRPRGVPYDIVIEEGALWPSIKEVIAKHKIDLVVAGKHGAGALHKVLLGSGAEQIFRHARCPVHRTGSRTGEARGEVREHLVCHGLWPGSRT
jgi:nucleotide-binding universal stress UspA family protein